MAVKCWCGICQKCKLQFRPLANQKFRKVYIIEILAKVGELRIGLNLQEKSKVKSLNISLDSSLNRSLNIKLNKSWDKRLNKSF